MGWFTDADRFNDFIIEPGVIEEPGENGHVYPAVGFAFGRLASRDETEDSLTRTALLVATPQSLEMFLKRYDKARRDAVIRASHRRMDKIRGIE